MATQTGWLGVPVVGPAIPYRVAFIASFRKTVEDLWQRKEAVDELVGVVGFIIK